MPLPTQHLLRAAVRVIGLIDEDGETLGTLRSAYSSDPNDGAYRSEELMKGQVILHQCGLLEVHGASIGVLSEARIIALLPEGEAFKVLTERLLREERPPWLSIAAGNEMRLEYIPDCALERLEGIVSNPEEMARLLATAARKVNAELLRKSGEEGERAVVALCRSELEDRGRADLARCVVQVSRLSDQLGYDVVSPDLTGSFLHIEVKTQTGRRRMIRVFLSRNETEQAQRDPRWILVACERDGRGTVRVLGWCGYESLCKLLPYDSEDPKRGRWTSAELTISREKFKPGLPIDEES